MPVAWSLELCSIGYIWVVFWSCGILVSERRQIVFDLLYNMFPPRPRRVLAIVNTGTLGLDLPRGPAGRGRLRPVPRPADLDCCCISAWTWSIPAS